MSDASIDSISQGYDRGLFESVGCPRSPWFRQMVWADQRSHRFPVSAWLTSLCRVHPADLRYQSQLGWFRANPYWKFTPFAPNGGGGRIGSHLCRFAASCYGSPVGTDAFWAAKGRYRGFQSQTLRRGLLPDRFAEGSAYLGAPPQCLPFRLRFGLSDISTRSQVL